MVDCSIAWNLKLQHPVNLYFILNISRKDAKGMNENEIAKEVVDAVQAEKDGAAAILNYLWDGALISSFPGHEKEY